MPYDNISQLPEQFKALPSDAQRIAMNVINSVLDGGGDEESAFKQAWGSVKESYKQDGDKWVKKAAEKLETTTLKDVELLAIGKWNANPSEWKVDEKILDQIVESFNELRSDPKLNYDPPIKLGHDDKQKLLQQDGYPAAGWIRGIKKVGKKLVATVIEEVPQKIADLVKVGAYKYVSIEAYENYSIGGKKYPWVLKAASFLGGDVPAVKSINDILNNYQVEAEEGQEPIVAIYLSETTDELSSLLAKIDELLADETYKFKTGAPAIRSYLKEVKTKLKSMRIKKAAEEPLDEKARRVREAFYSQTRKAYINSESWIENVYSDHVISRIEGELYKVPYIDNEDGVEFNFLAKIPVELQYVELAENQVNINALPDSSFAYIEDGGEKDGEGKTTPRSLRHFPYKDAEGKIDAELLRESLAKVTQSELDQTAQEKAMKVLAKASKEQEGEVKNMELEKELQKILKLGEGGDILATVKQVVDAQAESEKKLAEQTAETAVNQAITDVKITPAQKEWATAYALKDPDGFKSFVASAPKVVELGERGHEGEEEGGEVIKDSKGHVVKLTDVDKEVCRLTGISEEDMLKEKAKEVV